MNLQKEDHFSIKTGDMLMTDALIPARFFISALLPQGLHLLAGAPKVGKSWLALWLCLQIAKGEPVWNYPTTKGTTLYLCLEDSYARIQNRLFDITDDAPPNVCFAIMANLIGKGLETQIENFVRDYPDTSLIVIDTLQKVRSLSNDNAYASDYRDLGILKALADKLGIAILLIHHLRKQLDDDPMNMVSGTTAITGAVDTSFVLKQDKRGSERAVLICDGRDIEYRELQISFDREEHLWKLISDSREEKPEPSDNVISVVSEYILEAGNFTGTATDLSAEIKKRLDMELRPNVLAKKLMQNQQEMKRLGITYGYHRTHERKEICLSRVGCVCNDGKIGTGTTRQFAAATVAPTQVQT